MFEAKELFIFYKVGSVWEMKKFDGCFRPQAVVISEFESVAIQHLNKLNGEKNEAA